MQNEGLTAAQARGSVGPIAEPASFVCRLPSRALIECSGADADGFLQGQLSNDTREITEYRSQLTCYNSPKGRVLAILVASRRSDRIYLSVSRSLIVPLIKRLRMYILRSKVALNDLSDAQASIGVAGGAGLAALAEIGMPVPQQPWDTAAAGEISLVRYPGDRMVLNGPAASLDTWSYALRQRVSEASENCWHLLDIKSGLPAVYPQTQDHFVAQMLNLDHLGAISFSKGCYPGQEIVARMHYLGKLKRRLSMGSASARVEPGTPVYSGADIAGEIVDCAADPARGFALLAVLQIAQLGQTLRLGTVDGIPFDVPEAAV